MLRFTERDLKVTAASIWATITSVKGEPSTGAKNSRIHARNAISRSFVEPEKMIIDDQHALMAQHNDLYEDSMHFNAAGSAMMGDQAAAIIRKALESWRQEQVACWRHLPVTGNNFPDAFMGTMGALQAFAEGSASTLPSHFEDAFHTMALVEALHRSSERHGEPLPLDE